MTGKQRPKVSHRVNIQEQVIAQVAGMAATSIDGVSGLKGNVADNLKAFLGEEGYPGSVATRVHEDRTARITLHVAIEYGYPIQEVARQLQATVKEEIETMTGLHVVGVDVYVTDLTLPEGSWASSSLAGRQAAAAEGGSPGDTSEGESPGAPEQP